MDNDDPALETLIQLDSSDIPSGKQDLLDEYSNILREREIPPTTIKENKFVAIDGQVLLIEFLREGRNLDGYYYSEQLPTNQCLDCSGIVILAT